MTSLSRVLFFLIIFSGLALPFSSNFWIVQASTPSVPEFTVTYVAHPYDVPTKTTPYVDPFTGKETVNEVPGHHVENESIEVMIENQFFNPYTDDEGKELNLYYFVQAKGHFGDDWDELVEEYLVDTSLEYTVITLSANYPEGGLVDFQVKAVVGYMYDVVADRPLLPPIYQLMHVETSGWSPTQTIAIENPQIPEFPSLMILPLFILIATIMIVCRNRLNKAKKNGVWA